MESRDGEKSMVSTGDDEPIFEEETIPVVETDSEVESSNEAMDKKDDDSCIAALDRNKFSFNDDDEAIHVPVPALMRKKKLHIPVAPPHIKSNNQKLYEQS
jgi:hypothetical protein